MNGLHSMLIGKGSGAAKDLLDDFGFVCTNISYPSVGKTKDIVSSNWKDKDGEDAYIPPKMMFEAFDVKVDVCFSCEYSPSLLNGEEQIINVSSSGLVTKVEGEQVKQSKYSSSLLSLNKLLNYLRSDLPLDGTGLKLWFELYKTGFKGCYLKEVSAPEYYYSINHEVVEVTLTFRVTAPTEEVVINKSEGVYKFI